MHILTGEQRGINHIGHRGHIVVADAVWMTQEAPLPIAGLEARGECLQELRGRGVCLPDVLLLCGRNFYLVADIQADLDDLGARAIDDISRLGITPQIGAGDWGDVAGDCDGATHHDQAAQCGGHLRLYADGERQIGQAVPAPPR